MIIIQILRYIFGYINFRAYGGFSDRFLNLCTRYGIPLWNIKNVKGNISATTTVEGYLSIRKAVKKSGMKTIVLEKKGLKFFLRKNKIRAGILMGAVVFVCIISFLTRFVWSVSLVGNVDIEEEQLLSAFEKYGVKVGSPISDLDEKEIAKKVVGEFDNLSWAAVNRKGTSVVIEVREKVVAPDMYDDKTPTNLVAEEDGVIISIDALYGEEEVKPGTAVTKGDLLISGIITHPDGTESFIHADGYVKAQVKRNKEFEGNNFLIYEPVNEKKQKSLFFFGARIPFGSSVGEKFFTEHKSFLESEKSLLPVGIITQYSAEFSKDPLQADERTRDILALWDNACYINELLDFNDITKSSVTLKKTKNGNCFAFYGECEQEIGVLQEIYIEKNGDNE